MQCTIFLFIYILNHKQKLKIKKQFFFLPLHDYFSQIKFFFVYLFFTVTYRLF